MLIPKQSVDNSIILGFFLKKRSTAQEHPFHR